MYINVVKQNLLVQCKRGKSGSSFMFYTYKLIYIIVVDRRNTFTISDLCINLYQSTSQIFIDLLWLELSFKLIWLELFLKDGWYRSQYRIKCSSYSFLRAAL